MSVDFRRHPMPDASPHPDLLRSVSEDLGRLDGMLNDAISRLTGTFNQIQQLAADCNSPEITLATFDAIGAMQFQDMASQLIAHCQQRLAVTEYDPTATIPFIATHFNNLSFGSVDQSDMTSGSIDLF
ncbi:hypothetical protein BH10PSE17_BH10PSE17_37800 [soil metagenome]